MRKKMFSFKNFVMLFMAIGLLTSIGCSKQDDSNKEVDDLKQEVATLRANLLKDFQTKMDTEIGKLNKEITNLQNADKVDPKDLDNKYVAKATYEAFVDKVSEEIKAADSKEALGNIETSINSVKGRVSALETLLAVSEGKSNYDFAELTKKVTENEEAIKKLIKATSEEAFKKEFDKLMEDIGVNIPALSGRLTSLVLLPEYVSDKGGALPIIKFSPLKTDACGEVVPAVTVRYVVSPSTVAKENIDTDNITFKYNAPKSLTARNTEVDQKAKFVSLEDGILTVEATLNTEKLWDSKTVNPDERIDQLMLQVPVAGSNEVVSSDWAKVISRPQELAIVKKPKTPRHADTDPWKLFELKRFVHQNPGSHPKDETVTEGVVVGDMAKDYTVVDMEYNKDLNISEYVQSMYKDIKTKDVDGIIALEKYGLHFEFDLVNHETNQPIVYNLGPRNNTNQQKFIDFKDDNVTLTTKVYTKEGNRAAIGKTPIVRVMLVKGEGDDRCVARTGYIKLNIIEKPVVVPPILYKKDLVAKCEEHEAYRVRTQEMNESFYHKVNMTKEEFHKNYTFKQLALDASDATNVGVIEQVKDDEVTDSYNLVYKIEEADVWKNIGKTVWAEGEYRDGTNVIKVRFEAPITAETVVLDITLDNYWYNGYANIVHNVAVPKSGATDSSECTWVNNINNAFKTYNEVENQDITVNTEKPENKLNLLHLGFRKDKETMERYNTYTYEYKFFTTQPASPVKDITLSVGPKGKELLATRGTTVETVATINPQAAGTGDPLEYHDGVLAKELLNAGPEAMKATVELIVYNSCPTPHRVDVVVKNLPKKDKFDVHFLRPINVSGKSTKDFVDAVNVGDEGSYIDMKEVAKLSDWRNYIKDTDKYDFVPNNENFYGYYGVTDIKADIKNIKVKGLKVSGEDVDRLTSNIKINQTVKDEMFEGKTYKYGRLTYENNGANLKEPFTMYVPVTVTYKWGEVVATVVEITVKPSSKTARKAAK